MLTLAAIAYRGFEIVQPDPDKSGVLHEAMSECLCKLGPVKDQWDIVWGPASFSAFDIGFADTTAYVAQNREKPTTYAVAVRGTNPICLFDWVFGDFMVGRQVPWAYGGGSAGGALISFSTALSLRILQHLRWQPQHPGPLHRIWEFLRSLGRAPADHDPIRRLNDDLTRLAGFAPTWDADVRKKWIAEIGQRVPFEIPGTSRNAWEESYQRLRIDGFDVPALIARITENEQAFVTGVDLRSFLAAAVAQCSDKIDIYVTGHSKGGALSPSIALWLADTQGTNNIREEERWDPACKATVFAYSFAGPTAGNTQFVRHSDSVIGQRCFRVVNRLDIVPHAWATEDLRQIPDLYSMNPVMRELLHTAMGTLINRLGELEYKQIGGNLTNLPGVHHGGELFAEIVHQHLDGYFEQMGLGDEMSTVTFFKPV